MVAVGAASAILFAMAHTAKMRLMADPSGGVRSGSATPGSPSGDDKDDDPNQIDTIVLGDPSEAPAPARRDHHVSPVHPTILIILPRDGKDFGMIPDTDSGRLLYAWLAAFNHSDGLALRAALPSSASPETVAAQLALRQQTGGFNLLSAREVQPGVLVFRLRDQSALANEALGTLEVRPDSIPARIESFSLRAVPSPEPKQNP